MKKQRKHYTPEEKVAILRRHLVEGVPISDLCDELGLQPTVFYRWQKEFFENGAVAFQQRGRSNHQPEQERIAYLEKKIQTKDEILAELMAEHVALKKRFGDEIVGLVEIVRPVARDPLLAGHFARLFACLTASRADCLAREENLLRSLIYILRQHGTARPSSSGPSPCVARALQRLNSAPDTSVSLAELAALSGVSRFQLLRGFAREVGITPHAYLVQRRVRLARKLLAYGHTPAQAAVQAGFADQSHMTRAFVRQLGITPGRYRAAVARSRAATRNSVQDAAGPSCDA